MNGRSYLRGRLLASSWDDIPRLMRVIELLNATDPAVAVSSISAILSTGAAYWTA